MIIYARMSVCNEGVVEKLFLMPSLSTTSFAALQALAVEKQRVADANRNKLAAKQKALAAQKKEHKQKSEKHKELFGADYDEIDPDMDQYYDMEDVSESHRLSGPFLCSPPRLHGNINGQTTIHIQEFM